MTDSGQTPFRVCAEALADEHDSDVVFFNGPIEWDWDSNCFIDFIKEGKLRSNILLILVTNGGDPDAAYRIARFLQRHYERFIVLIPGVCKSAGTLIATGAHELIITDHGELGPLDIQIAKMDELAKLASGLDVLQALNSLKDRAFSMFEDTMLDLKFRSGGRITLKTAMQVATDLTTGLFQPIYAQIDPTRLGEVSRQMRIGEEYGKRLNETAENLKEGALQELVAGYPAHGFVIDRDEAKKLFNNVRDTENREKELVGLLPRLTRTQMDTEGPGFFFLSDTSEEREGREHETKDDRADSKGKLKKVESASGDSGKGHPEEVEPGDTGESDKELSA